MKKLWGGRFKKEMHPLLKCFSYSLFVDCELLEAELRVNEAWAKMLSRAGLITRSEAARIARGLKGVGKKVRPRDPHDGMEKKYLHQYEDIHTLIQAELEKKIGPAAKKLHTGRSRNDLVVTSTRIWLRDKNELIQEKIAKFQKTLVAQAKRVGDTILPGLTHLKKAQPVLLAHHLLAYVEMLKGDTGRLQDLHKRIDVLPLGSAAFAGTSLPLDQKFLARELGFSKIAANSIAAVSDRALLTEFVAHLSILWMHLSRLAEDFILWNSEYFGFVELDDAFTTGSSLMPQKKNPDIFELIRGRAAVIFGHLQTLLALQKGLPLAYNRDLQEDKPAVFDAVRKTEIALDILALALSSASFNKEAMQAAASDDGLFATDVLEYLVRKGVNFSEAHAAVGKAVRFSAEAGRPLSELSLAEWKRFSNRFDSGVYDLFDTGRSVRAKKTFGSTNPQRVKREIAKWEKELKD